MVWYILFLVPALPYTGTQYVLYLIFLWLNIYKSYDSSTIQFQSSLEVSLGRQKCALPAGVYGHQWHKRALVVIGLSNERQRPSERGRGGRSAPRDDGWEEMKLGPVSSVHSMRGLAKTNRFTAPPLRNFVSTHVSLCVQDITDFFKHLQGII